jgi:hypothetical protein
MTKKTTLEKRKMKYLPGILRGLPLSEIDDEPSLICRDGILKRVRW